MATHKIVHIEFPAADDKQAAEFYGQLFDWPTDVDEAGYTMFNPAEGPVGGFNPLADGGHTPIKPGDVIVYVSTDNVEATLAKAESLGGRVLLGKTEIPGFGWYGLFADPTGNRVGVYTTRNNDGNTGDTSSG